MAASPEQACPTPPRPTGLGCGALPCGDRRRRARRRNGAAYLLVLSAGMLLSVIGIGIVTASRAATRAAGQEADLTEAALLAEAGVEWGMAAVAANAAGWRTAYTHNVEVPAKTVGRGTVTFKLVDALDGSLSNNAADAVRLYGIGRVGSATRVYRVQLSGTGATLDVLKAPAHAGGGLTVNGNVTVTGGPLSANGLLKVATGKVVTGDVQGTSLQMDGTVSGTQTTLAAALPMPQAAAFDTYKAAATVIPYPAGGSIAKKVLSPGTNTVSAAAGLNANGVYYIAVPAGQTLSITSSRLVATLVVELGTGASVVTSAAFAWDPPRADYPALVIKGTTGTVTLGGINGTLSEATSAANYNPAGTPSPYVGGSTDSLNDDTYPAELHGLVHVVGSAVTTAIGANLTLKGSVLADGAMTVAAGARLTADPTLAASPPAGYTAVTSMVPDAASWRWDAAP
jgi:hypothetical protein